MNSKRFLSRICCFFLLACLVAGFGPAKAYAQEKKPKPKVCVVKLRDGTEVKGAVTKTDKGIRVETPTAVREFKKEEVVSITEAVVTPHQEYQERLSKIDIKDAKALYGLAQWVFPKHGRNLKLLKAARKNLEDALKLDKDYVRAKLLLRQINARIKTLEDKTPKPPVDKDKKIKDLVSQRDILWIRLLELRLDPPKAEDRGIKIQYVKDQKGPKGKTALQRYVTSMIGQERSNWDRKGKRKNFLSWPRWRQVQEILENREEDVDLLRDIHVQRDPKFMIEFRSKIWPLIRKNCAQSNCHGGSKPKGGLKFFVSSSASEKADYTNFIILSGYQKKHQRLLSRQSPQDSLLLQYGLNREVSKNPHPLLNPKNPKSVITPMFQNNRAANYRMILEWTKKLRGPLLPDYHLKYKVPPGLDLDLSGKADLPFGKNPSK
ncbi:MAG: hypothetical protein K8S55_08365 [Phycisphaerae bacterium]|nr:hypothetical protein [Phycisphaerae bacterium]